MALKLLTYTNKFGYKSCYYKWPPRHPRRLRFQTWKSIDSSTKACSYKYCSNVPAAYLFWNALILNKFDPSLLFPYNDVEIVPAAQKFAEPLIAYNVAFVILFPYNAPEIVPAAQDFDEPLIINNLWCLFLVPISTAEIVPAAYLFWNPLILVILELVVFAPPTRLETQTKESNMYASHWVD